MITHQERQDYISRFSKYLGYDLTKTKQGSDEWLHAKLGVVSASNASKILKPKTQTYATYMNELIAQVATAEMPEQISAKPLAWGHAHEDAARANYELEMNTKVIEYPFFYLNDDMRAGCSVDGIDDDNKVTEIKCPYTTKVHIELIIDAKIKNEYEHQMQFSMFVTGTEACNFVSYDPRMKVHPLVIKSVERNEAAINLYNESLEEFIFKMDKKLAIVGVTFKDQWRK